MAKQDSKAPAKPANPFIGHAPDETMTQCAQVVAFMGDAIPAIQADGGVLDTDTAHGATWILRAVADALNHHAQERAS